MDPIKPVPSRTRILDAAERLLRQERAAFSMRDLAAEAGVSFATPFNRFGSKAGIMQALSDVRIARMQALFDASTPPDDVVPRLRSAVGIAARVMLEEPVVNRTVMGWLGAPSGASGAVLQRSRGYWARALGEAPEGPDPLPTQLALAFRGALSFWSAGELPDDRLEPEVSAMAIALLRGAAQRS